MTKKLKIKLLPNGRVEMTTEGIKGKKCLDYVEFLEKLADVRVLEQEFTSEYYENNAVISQDEEVQVRYDN